LNFLKKAGAVLLLVAVFASSCNKYADDFKQINTKLDALAQQVAGVTTLSTSMTALAAQVTALQTAVAGLPTTASITTLTANLKTVSDNVVALQTKLQSVADAGTATKAVVDQLKTDLGALAKKVADDDKALTDQITALGTTDVAQSAALLALKDQNTALASQITSAQAALIADNDVTQAAIAALQLIVNSQKAALDQLLANSNMFTGDVNITSPAEVTFWAKKISSLGMINGKLTINTTALAGKLDSVNYITKNINAVIGAASNVTVTSTSTATLLDLSKLVSVAGNYSVTGVKISDSNLSSVGGNFTVAYDGAYVYPNLTTIGGNLTLTQIPSSTTAPVTTGTTLISLPVVKVTGSVFDGVLTDPAGTVVFPDATSIELAGGVSTLTANNATNVKIGTVDYAGSLTINASKATTVDLSAAKTAGGAVAITADPTATVKLDLFNSNVAVTISKVKSVTLPSLVSGTLSFPDATSVTLAKFDGATAPSMSNVTTLTMGALNSSFALAAYTKLTSIDITGKTATAVPMVTTAGIVTTTANNVLATVKLGGVLNSVNLTGLVKLASLTTSGVINSITVDGASILTGASFGHTHYVGGTGSELIIKNNPKLTSLSSGVLDYPQTITVTNNVLLTSLNLSSYKTPLLGGTTAITINGNKLSGTYTNAIAGTPTTPYVETTITSADLNTLKAFVAMYPTKAPFVPAITLAVNLDLVKILSTDTAAPLSSWMGSDSAHTPAFAAPGTGITTQAEFALVK
jgi:hypothetical protein